MKTKRPKPLRFLCLMAVVASTADSVRSQDILVRPARGGGLDTNSPMIHVDIFYDYAASQMHATVDTNYGIPKLTPLPPGYAFDVRSNYYVLSDKGVFALPAVVLGPGDTLEFLNRVLLGSGGVQRGAGGPNSQSLKNVLARIYPGSRDTVEAWRVAFTALGYLLLWMNLVLVFLLRKLGRHEALTISFMVLFLSIPLFVATSWPHYLVYLPFCQVLAFERLRQTYEPSRVRRRILASLLGVSVALASVMVFDLIGSWERYTGAGLLFRSNLSLDIQAAPDHPCVRRRLLDRSDWCWKLVCRINRHPESVCLPV